MDDGDGIVEQGTLKNNINAFYADQNENCEKPEACQSEAQAMAVFFGDEERKPGQLMPQPIPGYSGTNRRIGADNLFGMTYAEARNAACQSQSNIDNEKGNTLTQTSKFVPAYENRGPRNQWDM